MRYGGSRWLIQPGLKAELPHKIETIRNTRSVALFEAFKKGRIEEENFKNF